MENKTVLTMTKKEYHIESLKASALEMLKNDDDLFCDMVNEMDSWNGYADGFRGFPMYELNDLFCDCKVSDFLDKLGRDFNHNDEYFFDTIYGLESGDSLTDVYRDNVWEADLLDAIIDNANHLYFSDSDFENIINEIIEAQDAEEEDTADNE